jgi:hypothetical protein
MTIRADGEAGVIYGDDIGITPVSGKIHRFDAQGLALQ